MFKERLISGVLLMILALATIISGGMILFFTLMIVSLIGMYELYRVLKIEKTVLGFAGYAACILYYGIVFIGKKELIILGLLLALVTFMCIYVFAFPKYHSNQVMLAFFGVVYVGIMLSYIYQTRMLQDGIFVVWLVIFCSWGCDTCAYCVGVLFGKHKMAPILSPKKSVEGAIGGLVGAGLLGLAYGFLINAVTMTVVNPWIYLAICVLGGGVSMVGDLAASGIKRNYEVKDYGKLIPGHGGILDRFDSVIFTAPIIYYLAVYLIK